MAATTTHTITTTKPPKVALAAASTATTRLQVCFSFAAYAKTLIDHLRSLDIPVLPGLTDHEFTSIEANFRFSFPPDLRSILQEGLPVGPHFPNWRSSSPQQLQILLNLPNLNLSKNISQNNFWVDSWGDRPLDTTKAVNVSKKLSDKAPVLVPIYRNCYIPSTPNTAGNPVFYVDEGAIRIQSFDITRFFQEFESLQACSDVNRAVNFRRNDRSQINVPAWAATAARRIGFWTEAAEKGRRVVAGEKVWWSGVGGRESSDGRELRNCLEEVFWRLREGGWKEEEVREMMMMNGSDSVGGERGCKIGAQISKESVVLHVKAMSRVLLRAGWSREDVVQSLDLPMDDENPSSRTSASTTNSPPSGGKTKSLFDFEPPTKTFSGVPQN